MGFFNAFHVNDPPLLSSEYLHVPPWKQHAAVLFLNTMWWLI